MSKRGNCIYIDALLRNLEKRFGDMAKQVAVAARIFDHQRPPASKEDTLNALELLCSTFRLDQQCAVGEWNIFASFLAKRSQCSLTELLQALITSDLRDAFPVLSQLSSILLVCLSTWYSHCGTFIFSDVHKTSAASNCRTFERLDGDICGRTGHIISQ